MILMIILMINSLFISSSQNFHHEQTQQRVSDAKIGRFRSFTSMLCSMPAEQKRKRPETFFFFFSLAPQLVQFPVGCRDLSQNEIVSETCVKKKPKEKEGRKVLFNEKKVQSPMQWLCVFCYAAMCRCWRIEHIPYETVLKVVPLSMVL